MRLASACNISGAAILLIANLHKSTTMARPLGNAPDFRIREEDRSHPDMDSDTSEGREAMERADAVMEAAMERRLQHRREESERAREAAYAHYGIPEALYEKAVNHQDQLTEAERQLLLTRSGAVGKALAQPEALTEEETYEILCWPAPDVVRANIQAARNGSPSTPFELYSRGKDALAQGRPLTDMLNHEEILLLARYFYTKATYNFGARVGALCQPGAGEAHKLLQNRLGLEHAVFHAATEYQIQQISRPTSSLSLEYIPLQRPLGPLTQEEPQEVMYAIVTLNEQRQNGSITAEEANARSEECLKALRLLTENKKVPDYLKRRGPKVPDIVTAEDMRGAGGAGPWPPMTGISAFGLFMQDKEIGGWWAHPGWLALSEEQRQAYREQCESLRREAWAEHERKEAACKNEVQRSPPGCLGQGNKGNREDTANRPPRRPYPLTAWKLLREESDLGGVELKNRFDSMTGEEKQALEERAQALNARNQAAWDEWHRRNPGNELLKAPVFVTGLGLYTAQLGVEFPEALRRWEGLTAEQKRPYEDRATTQNAATNAMRGARREAWRK